MTEYTIRDGMMYKAEMTVLENPGDVFGALNDDFITYIAEVGNGIHLGLKSSGGTLHHLFIKEVSHLRFSTMFGVDESITEDGTMEHFIDYHGGIMGVTDWVVPEGYRMFFAYESMGGSFPFHMLLVKPNGKFAMIPMSNCHDGGSVCHGNVPIPARSGDIVTSFQKAMDAYWNSDWNDHLINEDKFIDHNRYIFRWDMDMNQLPMIDPDRHLDEMNPKFSGASLIRTVMNKQPKLEYEGSKDPKAGNKKATKKRPRKKVPAKDAKDGEA
jgi:hypothetical protein